MNGRLGAVAVAACLGLLAGCASAPPAPVYTPPPTLPPMDPVAVAAAVDPALVNIASDGGLFDATASGSGIVLTPDGEVLTSHHVIKGADRIDVVDVGTGATYVATVLGYDRDRDIALLDLPDVDGLSVARLAADPPRVGTEVLAIGNAGGTGGVPTAVGGRIIDLDRTIVARNAGDLTRNALSGLIEVRAPVTAGQSGGALVDSTGAVLGVLAAASGRVSESDQPRGFAVPIDDALEVVEQIRSGVSTDAVHIGPTATLGVLISNASNGVRVGAALYGQPAAQADIPDAAVILALDGRPVGSVSDVRAVIDRMSPGETISVGWLDAAGARHDTAVAVGEGTP
ncbi:MAG TPA: trypsin-like peptidase domain-containing protein [Aldersonia sp.]